MIRVMVGPTHEDLPSGKTVEDVCEEIIEEIFKTKPAKPAPTIDITTMDVDATPNAPAEQEDEDEDKDDEEAVEHITASLESAGDDQQSAEQPSDPESAAASSNSLQSRKQETKVRLNECWLASLWFGPLAARGKRVRDWCPTLGGPGEITPTEAPKSRSDLQRAAEAERRSRELAVQLQGQSMLSQSLVHSADKVAAALSQGATSHLEQQLMVVEAEMKIRSAQLDELKTVLKYATGATKDVAVDKLTKLALHTPMPQAPSFSLTSQSVPSSALSATSSSVPLATSHAPSTASASDQSTATFASFLHNGDMAAVAPQDIVIPQPLPNSPAHAPAVAESLKRKSPPTQSTDQTARPTAKPKAQPKAKPKAKPKVAAAPKAAAKPKGAAQLKRTVRGVAKDSGDFDYF